MKNLKLAEYGVPILLLFVLYAAVIMFRPLLPVDETRYMTVAWEMHLRGDWLAPLTVNFQPYHHKPPLLFWLINIAWSIFGVSRWAGTIPVLLSSIVCVLLIKKFASTLFSENKKVQDNISFFVIGSVPFLIYSLLVMFDTTLTVFVLLSLLALLIFANSGQVKYLLFFSLTMGLGVLTKGPVAWLYVVFPILFGPFWTPQQIRPMKWYGCCFIAFLLSIIPVLLWLIPMLSQSSDQFAITLLWEQTAGRITGHMGGAHARPVWFYLPLLFVLLMPWIFFPSFWRGLRTIRQDYKNNWSVRFIILWIVPVFIAFSLISGKQPHYLVPLLPGVLILMALWITAPFKKIALVSVLMVFLICGVQWVASLNFFIKYDLRPMTDYLQDHKNHDWAYVTNYHGELTFLGRLEKTINEEHMYSIDSWFEDHPNGLAIIRYDNNNQIAKYKMLFDMPYRGRRMGVFKEK